jgi:hypothetical protein
MTLLQHSKEVDAAMKQQGDKSVKVTLPKDNNNLIPPIPENKNTNNEAVQKRMANDQVTVDGQKVPKGTTGTDLSAQAKAAAKGAPGADPSSQGKPTAGTTVPVYPGTK